MDMSERLPLPWWVTGIRRMGDDGSWETPYNISGFVTVDGEREENPFFSSIEDGALVFYQIHEDGDGFYCRRTGQFRLNSYNEFVVEYGDIPGILCISDVFMNGVYYYMSLALSRMPYYDELKRGGFEISIRNAWHVFTMFLENRHKLVQPLIEAGAMEYVISLFKGKVTQMISKPVAMLCSKYSLTENVRCMERVATLCLSFGTAGVDNLFRFSQYFKQDIPSVVSVLLRNNLVDFTKFLDYLVRSVFVYGSIPRLLEDNSSLSQFINLYCDYLRITEGNDRDIYPQNLKEAHDVALNRYESACISVKMDKFLQAIAGYAGLSWEDKETGISIIVPSSPSDLLEESRSMNHCVKWYASRVEEGISKILFARKNGKPYMTIEVRDEEIYQAKKKKNEFPDADDEEWLARFAEDKNLRIKSF